MTKNDIEAIFDAGGLLEEHFPLFEYREGQLLMAELVRQSFEEDAIAAIEAGTGIGKSFAYVAVALYNALQNPDERTVIATSTINLQRQLIEKDIPALFAALGKECTVALAVGRANYVCIQRYVQVKEAAALLAQDPTSELYQVGQWLQTTKTGLFAEYPNHLSAELRNEIACDADLCNPQTCPYFHECFYFKARAQWAKAQIIVTNHHLLFSDARSRLESDLGYDQEHILPSFNHLIIDEAHNIEANATEFFTELYSSRWIHQQTSRIQRSSRYTPNSLLEQIAPYSTDPLGADGIIEELASLNAEVEALDQYLLGVFAKNHYQPVLVTLEHQERLESFKTLAVEVAKKCRSLSKKIFDFAQKSSVPEELESRLNELIVRSNRIDSLGEVLALFTDYATWGEDVHWFNSERFRSDISVEVRITPLSVAPLMVEALFSKLQSVVATSATLDLHDDFEFWAKRVGLPYTSDRPFLKGTFASPFEYKTNLLLITPEDAPLPAKEIEEDYLSYMSQTILEATLASGGGALVLFTSYALLKEVHARLVEHYEKADLLLLAQGELDRHTLLRTFVAERDSVLFATSSFWEGVDAPGDTLRLVVITKLPFAVPSDPVFKARCDAIDAAGGSGFFELSLKNATMKLKQGFGRLIRSSSDRGVVLILDSRVVQRQYGQFMLHSLPESFHQAGPSSSISQKIESFLFP